MDKMARIIIGIHGLGNKPAPSLMHKWWRRSLHEGLSLIGHPRRRIPFETVYWADIFHQLPYDPKIKDKKDERFLAEPYLPSPGRQTLRFAPVRKKILEFLEEQLKQIDLDVNGSIIWKHLNDLVIRNYFQELDAYYTNRLNPVQGSHLTYRDAVRARLADRLYAHRDKEILLIAHSMGSIIAYDVLTQSVPEIDIHTFVTIGSPLGIPVVMQKIRQALNLEKGERLRTPENISDSWYNYADLGDKVAFNYQLSDDYNPNDKGIAPTDVQVVNDYMINHDHNPHKAYGYLRTPELARLCFDFLSEGQSPAAIRSLDTLFKIYEQSLRILRITK
ncbi:hypothetical protein JXO59_13990 [candidate division KSB1 bacterium]|nr:hypothetical protein [candidate division KSB1 bacterium]